MREFRRNKISASACAIVAAASTLAQAVPVQPPNGTSVPCAILERLEGSVQVLDASRTEMLMAAPHSQLRCGFWVSVQSGYAVIQHRDGHTVHLGAGSFAQFPDNNKDGYFSGDHVVLYKGQAYVNAPNGFREFRVATANGRARTRNAQSIVVFGEDSETTQLIGIEKSATLENRFVPTARIAVKPGEATSIDLGGKRVVPTTPRAVSVAAMKEKVFALRLGEGDRARAIEVAKGRHDRPFPTELVENTYRPVSPVAERKPASDETYPAVDHRIATEPVGELIEVAPRGSSSYERHILDAEESEQIEDMIAQKLTTGTRESVPQRKAWSERPAARRAPAGTAPRHSARSGKRVSIHDVSGSHRWGVQRLGTDRLKQEENERARLIEELSRITPD